MGNQPVDETIRTNRKAQFVVIIAGAFLLLCFLAHLLLSVFHAPVIHRKPRDRTGYPEIRKVFILASFNRGYSWTDNMLQGIDEELKESDLSAETFVWYMDLKRVQPSQAYFAGLYALLHTAYAGNKFDAVMACDNDAFDFLMEYKDRLFPGLPVVFVSLNDYSPALLNGRNDFTGTSENTDYVETIRTALAIRPQTSTVVSVVDGTTTGLAHRSAMSKIEPVFAGRLEFRYLSMADFTQEELGKELSKLSADSIVLLLHHFKDRNGVSYPLPESTEYLTSLSSVPCFVLSDIRLGYGVLGGDVVSGYYHGRAASAMTVRLLKGTPIADIPVLLESPNKLIFDYHVMRRFGISKRILPKGSIILNDPFAVLQEYKKQVEVILFVFAFLLYILIILFFEIMTRRKTELNLKNVLEKISLATRSAKLGLWDWDIRKNRLEWDDRMFEIFGIPKKKFSGSYNAWSDTLHPLDSERAQEEIRMALRGEKEFDTEFRIIGPDSSIRTIKANGQVIRDAKGQAIRMLGVNNDITEQKKLELQLVHSEKLSAIGQLASGIAHEFNNILAVIKGYAGLLLEEGLSPQERMDAAKTIDTQTDRGKELVTGILSFSRPLPIRRTPCFIVRIIDNVLALQRKQLELENISVIRDFETDIQVPADEGYMQQVFLNIVINARHAILPHRSGTIRIRIRRQSGSAVISVRDDGEGMDETVKKNIFTPFFTTKGAMAKDNRNIKGSGLGLAVSHRIIDQHGGTISVESDPGKGAEFTVTLPVLNTALETPRAVPDIPAERKALVSPFLKIFVVDDEPDLAALLTHYLSRKHSEHTRFALNPEEALQSIRKEPVDVVFCDIRMPGMRGDEFWEILRKTNPEIRIIFMTGELEASSDAMVKSGAAGFIRKPYSFHEIDSVLASLK